MKSLYAVLLSVLLFVSGAAAWAAQQTGHDLPIVTGVHWVDSSLEQKRAYLFGVGNMLEIEQAMAGDNLEAMRGRSIVPVLLKGLSGTPIESLVTQLDNYYAAHADQVSRPVIEVLYIEMALPSAK